MRAAKRGSAEGLEHLPERLQLVDLGLPVRADDERGSRPEPARNVLEGLDRELRAVELLEREEERLAARDSRERAGDELEDRDLVLGLGSVPGLDRSGVAARRGAQLADLRENGEEREKVARQVREVRARRFRETGVLRAEIVLDELAETLVGEGAVVLLTYLPR